jgi:Tfp pilus assembly protein PilW
VSTRELIRNESGVTLFEALLTVVVGMGVLGVVFLVMTTSFTQTAKLHDRVEAVQRGRVAMENITRQLRSQVCPSTTGAALTNAGDNTLTFYTDLSGGTNSPEQRTITFDPTAQTLTEYRYVGTGTWPNMTYPASSSPTYTRVLARNVTPVAGTPVFSYYAFPTNGATTHERLAAQVAATDLPRIVRVEVSFVSQPSRTNQSPRSTTFQSAVDTRTTDPNNPMEGTRCL